MRTDVWKFIQKCTTCLLTRQDRQRHPMVHIEIPHSPWQMISCILIGTFFLSKQGNTYLLTVIDYLTSWVESIPLVNKKADTIQTAFATQIWPRHGIPEVIICNRDTEFRAPCTQKYFKQLGIDQLVYNHYAVLVHRLPQKVLYPNIPRDVWTN